jgi:acetyl-CoA C-acetyltransferase
MKQKAFRRVCVIGAAQRTVRKEEGPAPEPLFLWEDVCRKAVSDATARGDVLAAINSVQLMYCESWRYDEPARRLTERLGINPAQCSEATIGGHMPQMLVQTAGEAILRGELDVALVCGGEALATVQRLQMGGEGPNWSFPAHAETVYPYTPNAIESRAGFAGHGAPFALSTIGASSANFSPG